MTQLNKAHAHGVWQVSAGTVPRAADLAMSAADLASNAVAGGTAPATASAAAAAPAAAAAAGGSFADAQSIGATGRRGSSLRRVVPGLSEEEVEVSTSLCMQAHCQDCGPPCVVLAEGQSVGVAGRQ